MKGLYEGGERQLNNIKFGHKLNQPISVTPMHGGAIFPSMLMIHNPAHIRHANARCYFPCKAADA